MHSSYLTKSNMTLTLPKAILFDLDGTLADTAPDLAAAINRMRLKRDLPLVDYEILRPQASAGAPGLLAAGFQITPEDANFPAMREELLNNYAANIADHSQLFEQIPELLQGLENLGIIWGIVTNKPMRFTDALLPLIGLGHTSCSISGDTTAHAKPHPLPLLTACELIQVQAHECWYVGDDLRDIQAGKAASMKTIAAAWGYCGSVEPNHWNADFILQSPSDLLKLIQEISTVLPLETN
jgi:phosphoglycolate phosphatase